MKEINGSSPEQKSMVATSVQIANAAQSMFGWQIACAMSLFTDDEQEKLLKWVISDDYVKILHLMDDFNCSSLGDLMDNYTEMLTSSMLDHLDLLSKHIDLHEIKL